MYANWHLIYSNFFSFLVCFNLNSGAERVQGKWGSDSCEHFIACPLASHNLCHMRSVFLFYMTVGRLWKHLQYIAWPFVLKLWKTSLLALDANAEPVIQYVRFPASGMLTITCTHTLMWTRLRKMPLTVWASWSKSKDGFSLSERGSHIQNISNPSFKNFTGYQSALESSSTKFELCALTPSLKLVLSISRNSWLFTTRPDTPFCVRYKHLLSSSDESKNLRRTIFFFHRPQRVKLIIACLSFAIFIFF